LVHDDFISSWDTVVKFQIACHLHGVINSSIVLIPKETVLVFYHNKISVLSWWINLWVLWYWLLFLM